MAKLLTVSVSTAQTRSYDHPADDRQSEWISGIFKQPVTESVRVGTLNLAGDQQADPFGGLQRGHLGHQLAEDHVHVGHEAERQRDG